MKDEKERSSRVCSTPFGITEVLTDALLRAADQLGLCSTPFGITEVLTGSAPAQTKIA